MIFLSFLICLQINLLDVATPPNTFAELLAMPKTDDPNAFDGDDGVAAPPKIEAVLVLLFTLALAPPKIFEAGFAATAPPKIFPVAVGEPAVDAAGVDEPSPKPPNDNDALSTDFAPKIFPPDAG